jgi:hypothetical protein
MSKDTITIDGVDSPIKIVVLQRGWVAIGRYEAKSDTEHILADASVIRVWGTTQGLGQLASGPTSKTVLDKAGTVRFNPLTTVLVIDAEESAWADKL